MDVYIAPDVNTTEFVTFLPPSMNNSDDVVVVIKKEPEDGKITIDNGTMIYNGTCGGPYTVEYEACADNTVCQIVRRKFSAPCTVTEYPVVLNGMDYATLSSGIGFHGVMMPNLVWLGVSLMSKSAEQSFVGVMTPTYFSEFGAGFQWASGRMPTPWADTTSTSTMYTGEVGRRRLLGVHDGDLAQLGPNSARKLLGEEDSPKRASSAADLMARLGLNDASELMIGHLFWFFMLTMLSASVTALCARCCCKRVTQSVTLMAVNMCCMLFYMPLCVSAWYALVNGDSATSPGGILSVLVLVAAVVVPMYLLKSRFWEKLGLGEDNTKLKRFAANGMPLDRDEDSTIGQIEAAANAASRFSASEDSDSDVRDPPASNPPAPPATETEHKHSHAFGAVVPMGSERSLERVGSLSSVDKPRAIAENLEKDLTLHVADDGGKWQRLHALGALYRVGMGWWLVVTLLFHCFPMAIVLGAMGSAPAAQSAFAILLVAGYLLALAHFSPYASVSYHRLDMILQMCQLVSYLMFFGIAAGANDGTSELFYVIYVANWLGLFIVLFYPLFGFFSMVRAAIKLRGYHERHPKYDLHHMLVFRQISHVDMYARCKHFFAGGTSTKMHYHNVVVEMFDDDDDVWGDHFYLRNFMYTGYVPNEADEQSRAFRTHNKHLQEQLEQAKASLSSGLGAGGLDQSHQGPVVGVDAFSKGSDVETDEPLGPLPSIPEIEHKPRPSQLPSLGLDEFEPPSEAKKTFKKSMITLMDDDFSETIELPSENILGNREGKDLLSGLPEMTSSKKKKKKRRSVKKKKKKAMIMLQDDTSFASHDASSVSESDFGSRNSSTRSSVSDALPELGQSLPTKRAMIVLDDEDAGANQTDDGKDSKTSGFLSPPSTSKHNRRSKVVLHDSNPSEDALSGLLAGVVTPTPKKKKKKRKSRSSQRKSMIVLDDSASESALPKVTPQKKPLKKRAMIMLTEDSE
jgi:hypothetical protein